MNTKKLFLMATLLLVFISAFFVGASSREPSQEPTDQVIDGLSVTSPLLNMGEVWEDCAVNLALPIHNSTNYQIDIREFSTSCGCTEVKPKSLSIPANQSATVHLTMDLTHRSLAEIGLAQRTFAVNIQPIISSGQKRNAGWRLHGIVKSRITLDATAIHFGERPVHGGAPVTQKVLATVHIPCETLEVSVDGNVATATVNRIKDREERFEILVSPKTSLDPGNFKTEAKIHILQSGGNRILAWTLPIEGKMQPEVRLLPSRVFLEPTDIGKIAEVVVTLQKLPNTKITIDHIETDSPGLMVETVAIEGIPAGDAYRIRQKVVKEGQHHSSARFFVRRPDNQLKALTIDIFVLGLANGQKPAKRETKEETP